MPTVRSLITNYRTGLQSPITGQTHGAWIDCDTVEGHLLRIAFVPDNIALPPNITEPLYPDHPEYLHILFAKLWVPSSHFVWYLDLLRNEVPGVILSVDNPNANRVVSDWSLSAWGHIE